MYSRPNKEQSSFNSLTFAWSFDTAFLVGVLNVGRLFFLSGSLREGFLCVNWEETLFAMAPEQNEFFNLFFTLV